MTFKQQVWVENNPLFFAFSFQHLWNFMDLDCWKKEEKSINFQQNSTISCTYNNKVSWSVLNWFPVLEETQSFFEHPFKFCVSHLHRAHFPEQKNRERHRDLNQRFKADAASFSLNLVSSSTGHHSRKPIGSICIHYITQQKTMMMMIQIIVQRKSHFKLLDWLEKFQNLQVETLHSALAKNMTIIMEKFANILVKVSMAFLQRSSVFLCSIVLKVSFLLLFTWMARDDDDDDDDHANSIVQMFTRLQQQ